MKKYKITGIEKCLTGCISDDPNRPAMQFLSLQHGMLWSTDGRRLFGTRNVSNFDDYLGSNKLFYVEPLKLTGCLTSLSSERQYTYPDLNPIIPKSISQYRTYNFKLPNFIGDLKSKNDKLDAVMTFDFENGEIVLGYGDPESHSQICINARLLAPFVALDVQDAYTIKFWFDKANGPILLTPHDSTAEDFLTKDWLGLVMPIKRPDKLATKLAKISEKALG